MTGDSPDGYAWRPDPALSQASNAAFRKSAPG